MNASYFPDTSFLGHMKDIDEYMTKWNIENAVAGPGGYQSQSLLCSGWMTIQW